MSLEKSLLPELDHEMAGTRRALERIPDAKLDWRPHERSGTLGWLGMHLAQLPFWATTTVESEGLDLEGYPAAPVAQSTAEILETFDRHVAQARAAIAGTGDETWFGSWCLRMGDHVIFDMPRIAVLRSFVMNHIVHHRGQLTVYLRLLDVPVPALYGPSADEE